MQGAILNALNDWICILDERGRVILANEALARDHGCTPEALTGTSFLGLVPTEARDAVHVALRRAAGTDAPQTCQHETLVAGSGGAWCQWTFQRLQKNAAAVCALQTLATGRDITEQIRLQHQFLHAQRVASIGMLASGLRTISTMCWRPS